MGYGGEMARIRAEIVANYMRGHTAKVKCATWVGGGHRCQKDGGF